MNKAKRYSKVYIIILNYNGWKDTIECLESVLRNDYPNYQVIVVDNGSPNNSIEYIKAWAEGRQEVLTPEPTHPLYHLSHPPVKKPIPYIYYTREEAEKGSDFELEEKLTKEWQKQRILKKSKLISTSPYPLIFIQTGENLGFAGGNNVGIKYTLKKNDCKYVLLLNNDTVVEKNFLSELVKVAKYNPEAKIIGGKILYYDNPNKIWYAGGKLDLWRGSGYHFNIDKKDDRINGIKEVSFVTGCLMLINKRVFNHVSLLPEEYFLYLEDTDFCYSALCKGFKLYINLDSKIYHKVSSTVSGSNKISPTTVYYITRNRLHFMMKKQKSYVKKCAFLVFWGITRLCRLIQWMAEYKIENISAMFNGIKDTWKSSMGKLIK